MLRSTFTDRVREIITRYSMIPAASRIGVAVSGGADSVVLLHVLHRLASQFEAGLTVLHLNHKLRGAESDRDEKFVRELAESLVLDFYSERQHLPPGNTEQEAREARREFFFRQMRDRFLSRVALGHTRSDQAETVLFRLLRGSGISGLAGMRLQTSEGLIRPLLALSRQEVREWAAGEGIRWQEDSSNADLSFSRNRLRNVTIPALNVDFNSNLEGVLANTAAAAQAEEEYWEAEIQVIFARTARRTSLGLLLGVPELKTLHPAVQRRLIRHSLSQMRGNLRSIDFQHIEAVLGLCHSSHGHDRVIVPGVDALRSFETLLLAAPGRLSAVDRNYRIDLTPGREVELPGESGHICVHPVNSETQNCANFKSDRDFPSEIADVSQDVLTDGSLLRPLYVRNWEPGDELQRPGHNSAEKLKALFQEQRVLLWERRRWPVVVCEGEIVWTRQFGCAAKFKAAGREGRILRIVYRKPVEYNAV